MSEKHTSLPNQKELEKEIGDYLTRKYGNQVKIVSSGIVPQAVGEKETVVGDGQKEFSFNFNLVPGDLISYLDEYIIQQDHAKAVLATKVCTHFNRVRFFQQKERLNDKALGRVKNNILLIGPTGVGKTFLIKLIAWKLGVPFVKGDATKFSETGYVGGDVEDLVRDLVREADGNIERAQHGIIYIDEVDKIAHSEARVGADVSRGGVQRALLKPMEETEVDLKVPHDMIAQIEAMEQFRATGKREKRVVNTRNILFIMSGAFDGLDEIISRRLHKHSIGFEGDFVAARKRGLSLDRVRAEDLVQFGFESEFIGRLPVTAVLNELTADDLEAILTNPNCAVINAKKQDFMVYGIKLCFDRQVLREIARRAHGEKTGARGLVSVLERILLPFERELPSTDVKYLTVTPATIEDPELALRRLVSDQEERLRHKELFVVNRGEEIQRLVRFLEEKKQAYLLEKGVAITRYRLEFMAAQIVDEISDPDDVCAGLISRVNHIQGWQEIISDQCELKVLFEEAAIDHILASQPGTLKTLDAVCEKILKSMEYGLKLLKQKKHADEIIIPASGVDEPEKFINGLVENSFKL